MCKHFLFLFILHQWAGSVFSYTFLSIENKLALADRHTLILLLECIWHISYLIYHNFYDHIILVGCRFTVSMFLSKIMLKQIIWGEKNYSPCLILLLLEGSTEKMSGCCKLKSGGQWENLELKELVNTPPLDSSKCLCLQMDDSLRANLNFRTFGIYLFS